MDPTRTAVMALGPQTMAVHAGEPHPRHQGAAVTPIYQSATFLYGGEAGPDAYHTIRYTRCNNNPSQTTLGDKLAALEGAEAALPLASGMAAISTTLLTLLRSGDHMLIQRAAYGGTYDLVHTELPALGITATMVDSQEPDTWEQALRPNTKVIYVEAASNPLLEVPDLPAIVAFARAYSLTSVIDATFATPVNLRPLELGFDVVLHSATKYLNGHSDLIAGAVAGSKALITQITHKANHFGGALDPHACFLLQRGLKTLALRVRQQNTNALVLATWLEAQPQVSYVHYPGLPSHRQHAMVQQLFTGGGAGGVFSYELKGGVVAADAMLQALRLALVAPSLGGVETLVSRPATMSHAGLTQQQRQEAGISEGLIRVAVGIEDTDDLLSDFKQALAAASAMPSS